MYILGPPCLLVLGVKREHSSFKDHCCISEASVCFLGLRTGLSFFICGKMFSSLLFFLPLTPLPLQHSLIGKLIFFFFTNFCLFVFYFYIFPLFFWACYSKRCRREVVLGYALTHLLCAGQPCVLMRGVTPACPGTWAKGSTSLIYGQSSLHHVQLQEVSKN